MTCARNCRTRVTTERQIRNPAVVAIAEGARHFEHHDHQGAPPPAMSLPRRRGPRRA